MAITKASFKRLLQLEGTETGPRPDHLNPSSELSMRRCLTWEQYLETRSGFALEASSQNTLSLAAVALRFKDFPLKQDSSLNAVVRICKLF